MRKIFGFAVRRPREAWLVVRLAAWVAALSALVKLMPLPKVLSLMSAAPARKCLHANQPSEEKIAQLLDTVLAADALCFTPTCWKRAPVLHRYLALGGRQTRIVFGIRRGGGGNLLDGHAWIEEGGRPLFEAQQPNYTVTYTFPSSPAPGQV